MALNLVLNVSPNTGEQIKPKPIKRTKCEVYSRVVGYLRPVNQWNDGKQEEFKERRYIRVSL